MLLSFRFANHRSFRDEQQLNLSAVYEADAGRARSGGALPVAGIFGPNASGKSNLLDAFGYMRFLVGRSDREVEPGLGLARQAFRLDPAVAASPSSYVIDLLLNGVRYTYGFVIDDEAVLEEWLYSYPHKKQRKIFERVESAFTWGEATRGSHMTRLAELVAPTALFLSVAARFGGSARSIMSRSLDDGLAALHDVYSWVWVRQLRDGSHYGKAPRRIQWPDDERRRNILVEMLRSADLGLRDITSVNDAQAELFPDLLPSLRTPEAVSSSPRNRSVSVAGEKLRFHHQGATGEVVFDIADESEGTIRLLERAATAVTVLERGGLLLVDEIDASLHPLLTARLIELFQSRVVNIRGAQLVFTSHDATLLGFLDGEEILDRDQIWFAEKRADGTSIIYPLSDFKPKKEGENRVRRYLSGSYGAVPDVSMDLFDRALIAGRRAE